MNGDGTDGSWWRGVVEGQARSGRGDPPRGSRSEPTSGTCDWNVCDKSAGPQYVDQICVDDGGVDAVAAPDAVSAAWKATRRTRSGSTVRRACATSSRCPAVSLPGSTGSSPGGACRQATRLRGTAPPDGDERRARGFGPRIGGYRRSRGARGGDRRRRRGWRSRDRARDARRRARAAGRRGVDADPIRDVRELQHAMRAREDEVLGRSLARYLLGVRQGGGAHDAGGSREGKRVHADRAAGREQALRAQRRRAVGSMLLPEHAQTHRVRLGGG